MSTRSLADWLDHIERQHPKSIAMGLERVREVASRLDLGKPAKRVITVGGTNGKGSTVAFIEAIASAHGWKVGAYTSPHLLRYNERVRIAGVDATDEALVAGFEAVDIIQPWHFWNDRCYRTKKAEHREVPFNPVGLAHHALDDAVSQAHHLCDIFAAERAAKG